MMHFWQCPVGFINPEGWNIYSANSEIMQSFKLRFLHNMKVNKLSFSDILNYITCDRSLENYFDKRFKLKFNFTFF